MNDFGMADMRQFFDNVPALIMLVDREYRFRYVNSAYERVIGRPAAEIIGLTIEELRGRRFFEQLRPNLDAALGGQNVSTEVHADELAPLPWYESRYHPHHDGEGHIDGVFVLGVEITHRKQLEEKMRANAVRHELALNLGGIGVWEWDIISGTSLFDARTEQILGFGPGEYDGRVATYLNVLHPEDAQEHQQMIEKFLSDGPAEGDFHSVFRVLPPSGGMRWIETLWTPRFDEDNRLIGGIGTLIDITERKQSEDALLENQQRLEQLLLKMAEEHRVLSEAERIAQMGSWQYHDGLKTFSGSDNMYTLYGRDRALGPPTFEEWSALIHDEDRANVMSTISHALTSGENYTLDYRICHGHTGETRHMHSEVEVSTDIDGHRKLLGSVQDVTDQVRAAKKLQEGEALLRQIIDTTPNSIFIKDREGRYLLVSRHMARSHGFKPEQVIGKFDRDMAKDWLHDGRYEEHRNGELAVIDQKSPLYLPESEFTFANGSRRWYQTTKLPFTFAGDPDCILVISVDITERKRIEQQLELVNESLRRESEALEKKNVTLKEVLQHLQEERDEFRRGICDEIKRTLLPAVEKLRERIPKSRELSKIETGLRAITDESGSCQEGDITTLSPREVEICHLIANGKTSKEMADALSISLQTVHKHRSSIRRKLMLENTAVNLTSYLRSRPLP